MTQRSTTARATPGAWLGDTFGSILTVAALTAVLGGALAEHAGWPGRHVVAGWLAYAVLAGVVATAATLRLGRTRFGLANQVTLLRSGLVCLVGGALLTSGQMVGWSLPGLIAAALALDGVDG